MAIGWLAILQSVPWSEVISNAPKVAEGAKKLWSAVAKTAAPPELPAVEVQPRLSPEAPAIARLTVRITSLETAVSDLHTQMVASSELIKALAEQNTQLIKRAEANRLRTLWLAAALALVAAAALASLVLTVKSGA